MALSAFQREICQLVARNRLQNGESYLAGASALNELVGAPRLSRDLDVFHDTEEALSVSWQADRAVFEKGHYEGRVFRERQGFVEAEIRRGGDAVLMQWARDSAYRFFPLVQHAEFGLTLHPFDLATSKVLALVGRIEARDFVDTLTCDRQVQPLGYLAWAACGKDPGFSPLSILEEAARTARYTDAEIRALDFAGEAPDPQELSRTWRVQLAAARAVVATLPAEEAGRAVLDESGRLFRGDEEALRAALAAGALRYHRGSIRGAFYGALIVGIVDTVGRAFLPGILREFLDRAFAQAARAVKMCGDVLIAQLKPRFFAQPFQSIQRVEGVSGNAPSALAVHDSGKRIEHCVHVGRNVQAVELSVIAGIDDDGDLLRRHDCGKAFEEFCGADAARQDCDQMHKSRSLVVPARRDSLGMTARTIAKVHEAVRSSARRPAGAERKGWPQSLAEEVFFARADQLSRFAVLGCPGEVAYDRSRPTGGLTHDEFRRRRQLIRRGNHGR